MNNPYIYKRYTVQFIKDYNNALTQDKFGIIVEYYSTISKLSNMKNDKKIDKLRKQVKETKEVGIV